MKTECFFVYGTLKIGGRFAYDFDKYRITSQTATLKGYDLFNLGWFPGIIPGKGEVIGEVHEYKHADHVKNHMDAIEGYSSRNKDNSLYVRKETVVLTEDGKEIKANIYVFNQNIPDDAKKFEGGVWLLSKSSS